MTDLEDFPLRDKAGAHLAPAAASHWPMVRAGSSRAALQCDIVQVAPVNYEMAIVVPVHYAIGVTLALAYSLVCLALGLSSRNPFSALSFALATNALPWLVMFPAMGYGWFGAEGPPGTRLFLSSLANQGFYGLGLWLGAALTDLIRPVCRLRFATSFGHGGIGREIAPLLIEVANHNEDEIKYE